MALRITVTEAVFSQQTRRGSSKRSLGWDSNYMEAVRLALIQYHQDPNGPLEPGNRATLLGALYEWKRNHPREFNNRDKISGGVVRKLCVQCGLDDYRPSAAQAVLIRGQNRAHPDRRIDWTPHVTPLANDTVNALQKAVILGRRVAVIIIDLYGSDFQAQGLKRTHGNKNGSVGKNIIRVLKATRVKKRVPAPTDVPVFICCKTVTPPNQEIVSVFGNAIASMDKTIIRSGTNSVLHNTTLRHELLTKNVTGLFVVGFDANMCVAVSIFGSGAVGPVYQPGFLDYGFNVITSRYILASAGRPLRTQDGWPYMGSCNL